MVSEIKRVVSIGAHSLDAELLGGPLLLKKTAGEGVTAALAAAPFAPGWEEAP